MTFTIDHDTADKLELIADTESPVGRDVPTLFLAACRADAGFHGGFVSVNRVRAMLADAQIPPRRYSSLWAAYTGDGKPMRRVHDDAGQPVWDECQGSTSGNDGKPYPVRRWVG